MAQITHVYQTEASDQTHTGDLTYTTKFTVTGASFAASTEYIMLVQAQVRGDNTNGRFQYRTRIGTTTPEGSEMILEPSLSDVTNMHPYAFLHKFTTAATPDDVTFQIAPQQNTGDTALADTITLFAMSLDDLETTDWAYGEDTTDGDHTTTTTWGDEASVTFTPGNDGDDWLVIAWGSVHVAHTGKNWRYRIDFDGGTSLEPLLSSEGEDVTEEKPWTLMRPYNLDNTEHTFIVQSNDDASSGGENQHNISKIFALRLQAFEDVATLWNGGTFDTPDSNFNEIADLAFTATTTGNALVLGTCMAINGAAGGVVGARVQIGGVTEPTGKDSVWDHTTYDATDVPWVQVLSRVAITATATADIDVDARTNSGGSQDFVDRGFAAVSLELAGGAPTPVTITVPLKAYTFSGQVPAIGTGVLVTAPAAHAYTRTDYVPGIGISVLVTAPVAHSYTRTDYVPAISTGVNVLAPVPHSYTRTDYAPTVTTGALVNVVVPLHEYTRTDKVPSISTGVNMLMPVANAYTRTDYIPAISTGINVVSPVAHAYVRTDNVPGIGTGILVTAPNAHAYSLDSSNVPTISTGAGIACTTKIIALLAYIPEIATGAGVMPLVHDYTLLGLAPIFQNPGGAGGPVGLGCHRMTNVVSTASL